MGTFGNIGALFHSSEFPLQFGKVFLDSGRESAGTGTLGTLHVPKINVPGKAWFFSVYFN